jgi:molybdopterin converting factor small subunit|uniref:MoaD/ThiS family protein n=1 Tax=Fervidicoccus fontis TaxID=683846 RepID=A0A7J3SNE1_9CREN
MLRAYSKMAKVTVRFYGRLIDLLGEREITIEGVEKLSDVYDRLKERLGSKASIIFQEDGNPKTGIVVVINGEAATFKGGKEAKLFHNDQVTFDAIDVVQVEGGG